MSFNVKINGLNYEIVEEGNGAHCNMLDDSNYMDERGSMMGTCDNVHGKIYIHRDLEPERKKRTLIHELTHAIIDANGLNRDFSEENVCDFVENHYHTINTIVENYFKERG